MADCSRRRRRSLVEVSSSRLDIASRANAVTIAVNKAAYAGVRIQNGIADEENSQKPGDCSYSPSTSPSFASLFFPRSELAGEKSGISFPTRSKASAQKFTSWSVRQNLGHVIGGLLSGCWKGIDYTGGAVSSLRCQSGKVNYPVFWRSRTLYSNHPRVGPRQGQALWVGSEGCVLSGGCQHVANEGRGQRDLVGGLPGLLRCGETAWPLSCIRPSHGDI